jgi:hypothetical protein
VAVIVLVACGVTSGPAGFFFPQDIMASPVNMITGIILNKVFIIPSR